MIGAARMDYLEVARLLRCGRFDLSSEARCQIDIANYLGACVPLWARVEREVRLSPKDRIDFTVDRGVGIEVKMHPAGPGAVIAQLARYAAHDRIGALILLSNKAMVLPPMIGGKPCLGVSLGMGWL